MKRRTIAALLACTMVIGTLAGCSSEPKNPGDSDTTVTETTAAETTAAAQTGPKVFNDYMTTDIDTLNRSRSVKMRNGRMEIQSMWMM